jgi:hypothetical protein
MPSYLKGDSGFEELIGASPGTTQVVAGSL